METKLKRLFDFQRFSPNSRITAMMDEVDRYYGELSDDDLAFLSAAGDAFASFENEVKEEHAK